MKTFCPSPPTKGGAPIFRNILIAAALLVAAPALAQQAGRANAIQALSPTSSGYAEAAEGLRVHYQVYGEGEPIVVLAGALMPIKTMAQVIRPLSERRQVIAIDFEATAELVCVTPP